MSQRSCSFCRELGHRVTNCNDQRLIDFEISCNMQKVLYELETTISDDAKNRLRNWLFEKMLYQPQTVKAFSYRKCGATRRTDPADILHKIVEYVFRVDETTNDDFIPLNNDNSNRFLTHDSSLAFSLLNLSVRQIDEQIVPSIQSINAVVEPIEECELDASFECNICYDETLTNTKSCKLNCQHNFCVNCIATLIKTSHTQNKLASCAYCREIINEITVTKSSTLDQIFETTI